MPSVKRVLVSLKCLVSANFLGFSVLVCLIANDIECADRHAVLLVLIYCFLNNGFMKDAFKGFYFKCFLKTLVFVVVDFCCFKETLVSVSLTAFPGC